MLWLQAKSGSKSLKKGGFNFTYDGTPEWEKESFVNENKIYIYIAEI